MATTRDLLRRCEAVGVKLGLTADGTRPTARWPVGFNDVRLRAELKARRGELLEALRVRTFALKSDGVVLERVISGGAAIYVALAVESYQGAVAVGDLLWRCSDAGVQLLAVRGELLVAGRAVDARELLPAIVAARCELLEQLCSRPVAEAEAKPVALVAREVA